MSTKLNTKELTALQRHVYRWAQESAKDYNDANIAAPLSEVCQNGCSSGMVNHLIYTVDCVKFYRRHMKEINSMLAELCNDTGETPSNLFKRPGWDNEDPLARDDMNQNILAWFGFEETANRLLSMLEE